MNNGRNHSIYFNACKTFAKRGVIVAAVAATSFISGLSYAQYKPKQDSNTDLPKYGTINHSPDYSTNHSEHSHADHYDQLPDLGSSASKYLSDSDAIKLGLAFIRRSRFSLPYSSDPELLNYINELGDKLLNVSEDAGKNYDFHLIKSLSLIHI